MKINSITNEQLLDDLHESEADIKICRFALASGISKHKDGLPVQERLDRNIEIANVIRQELEKRKVCYVVTAEQKSH